MSCWGGTVEADEMARGRGSVPPPAPGGMSEQAAAAALARWEEANGDAAGIKVAKTPC